MPAYYVYLISSLPMLNFGMRPPFNFQGLIDRCRQLIPEEDLKIIESVSMTGSYVEISTNATIKKWQEFDIALRNELVKVRASRKKTDPLKYLRPDNFGYFQAAQIALYAHRIPSLVESEKALDQARWNFLDELNIGHYFDIDSLIIYAYKVLILERWEKIVHADNKRLLEETLGVS